MMEGTSISVSLAVLLLVVFALFKIWKGIKLLPQDTDLVLFIMRNVSLLFQELVELQENKLDYEYLKDTILTKLQVLIKESSLPSNIKGLATRENLEMLVEPLLKHLYEQKLDNSSSKIVRLGLYNEEEALDLVELEIQHIYNNLVKK